MDCKEYVGLIEAGDVALEGKKFDKGSGSRYEAEPSDDVKSWCFVDVAVWGGSERLQDK